MKKKQTGKFMAIALTAAMLGGMLAGCGNNAANAPADTTPAPETPAAESSAVQESTPAEETPAARSLPHRCWWMDLRRQIPILR